MPCLRAQWESFTADMDDDKRDSSLQPLGALEEGPDDVQGPLLLQEVEGGVHGAEGALFPRRGIGHSPMVALKVGEPGGRLLKPFPGGVEVDLGGGDGLVAQKVLDGVQLDAPFHQERGVGVAELVGGEAPGV